MVFLLLYGTSVDMMTAARKQQFYDWKNRNTNGNTNDPIQCESQMSRARSRIHNNKSYYTIWQAVNTTEMDMDTEHKQIFVIRQRISAMSDQAEPTTSQSCTD